jgi:hypothetical protein
MTKVAPLVSRLIALSAGHRSGGVAAAPAVAAYLHSIVPPTPTTALQTATSIVHRDVSFSSGDMAYAERPTTKDLQGCRARLHHE